MKRFGVLLGALVLAACCIWAITGSTDYETAVASGENNADVEAAIVGADNVILSLGGYASESGLIDTLSDEEIQTQIAAYNAQVDAYFTEDCVHYTNLKEMNQYYLEGALTGKVYYIVSSGNLDCKLTSIRYTDDATTAEANGYILGYANHVESEDDGGFDINCASNLLSLTAKLEKIDGTWKVCEYTYDYVEDWVPGDNANVASDQASTVNIADTTYSSFQEAYQAASEISVEEECTIHLEDVVDTDAETIVTVE